MPIPLNGPVSLASIRTELELPGAGPISLNDAAIRSFAGVPFGPISFRDLLGKSLRSKGVGGTEIEYFIGAQKFRAHVFNTNGNFTIEGVSATGSDIQYLVVGGGGGGGGGAGVFESGGGAGGGGGSGGIVTGLLPVLGPVTLFVNIGVGGGGGYTNMRGYTGGTSSIGGIVAQGGAGGGYGGVTGSDGGSAGGGGGGSGAAGGGNGEIGRAHV